MKNNEAIKWLGNLKNDLGNPHYECLWPYAQAIDEICELLEEQEPVEPKRGLAKTQKAWFCGACGFRLNRAGRFCSKCGKAVKWNADAAD